MIHNIIMFYSSVLFCSMLISDLFITAVYRISRNDRKFYLHTFLFLPPRNDKCNYILTLYLSLPLYLPISLCRFVSLVLSDTLLESEVRNDRCAALPYVPSAMKR